MLVAVSPYHLTTREPPAMAALLLAERVVTMIPAPREGTERASLRRAVERSPQYLRFMRSWEWSLPLWQAGVVSSALGEDDPGLDSYAAWERIQSEPGLEALRPLMRAELYESDERYLGELSRDILRAGPDPCFTVPVAAGLDHFAARTGAMVARAEPVSVAQRAEASGARPVAAVALPVLLQAEGATVLRARQALSGPLEGLRAALCSEVNAAREAPAERAQGGRGGSTALAASLRSAAAAYAEAFDRVLPRLGAAQDEARVVSGYVAVQVAAMGQDAVLRASLCAVDALRGGGGRRGVARADYPAGAPSVVSLFIRPLGR